MNKQEIFDFVDKQEIWHEVTEHEAAFTMEEALNMEMPYPDREAKNLFVRDDKKQNYYLITVCGPKRVQLKEFKKAQGTRRLSFASAEDLKEMLDVLPGSVSLLGLLNNEECNVKLFLDEEFVQGSGIFGHHGTHAQQHQNREQNSKHLLHFGPPNCTGCFFAYL